MERLLVSQARILGIAVTAAVFAIFTSFDARAQISAEQTATSWYEYVNVGAYDWDGPMQNAAAADGLPTGIASLDLSYGYCGINPIARVQYPWGVLTINLPTASALGSFLANVLAAQGQAICMLNNVGFRR